MNGLDQKAATAREVLPILKAFGLSDPTAIRSLGGTATRKWDVTTADGRHVVRMRRQEFADAELTRFHHEKIGRAHV